MSSSLAERSGVQLDAQTRERAADEQLRMVWSHSTAATLVATIFAILMAAHFGPSLGHWVLGWWLAAKVAISIIRVGQAQAYKRSAFPGGIVWRRITYWTLALDGAVWGVAAYHLMGSQATETSLAIASFIGVACGATFGLQASRIATAAYIVPIIVPMILGLALRQDSLGNYGSAGLGLLLLQMLVTAYRSDSRVSETFVLNESARVQAMHQDTVARSAFLAKVSHELRSPLQGIVSALDVLAMRHGPADSADDELISRIRRSSLLLNTHLRDLLTLAKGEAGRLEMRPEPFDVCSLVESVTSSAIDLAMSKGITLIVDVPAIREFVVADSARIDQVVTNLLVNSIRYTDAGQVRVALEPYDSDMRLLRFSISDTGPGIPEAMLPNLLSPDKAIAGRERRGEGSGIGLAIVRTLMDHLGGKIEVSSRIGKGTTFKLSIPAEAMQPDLQEEVRDSATGRVLIVDDRNDILDALTSVVEELGFECDTATSSAVGANLLASRIYDAALIDVEMPTKGGAELAAETRRGGGPNASTRFIGISAVDLTEEMKSAFDAWLTKPIEHGSLRRALLGPGQGARPSQPGLWSNVA